MITSIKLINISIPSPHIITCVCVYVRTLETYSLSKFQVYNTLLLPIVTMLDIWSPELII